MRVSLAALLVMVTLLAGCNSSRTTVTQSFRADEASTWNATLAAVKTFTGSEPASADAKMRTIVVKRAVADADRMATRAGSLKRCVTWSAVITVNPPDLDVKFAEGIVDPKDFTWIVVKASPTKTFTESSDRRPETETVVSTNASDVISRFLATVQAEIDRARTADTKPKP